MTYGPLISEQEVIKNMPNVAYITLDDGTTYDIKDIIARSAIAIQASQPSNVNTKVWIRSDNNGEVIAIPTMTEFEALQNRVTQLENN